MNAAFACWNHRIAPVFDSARQVLLVRAESGRIVSETQRVLPGELPVQKALHLAELGVGTLVCGAISRPLHGMVSAYGIRVIPFVAGDLREVVRAWIQDALTGDTFAMPGCSGRGRGRFREMHGIKWEDSIMNGRGGGRGQGGGRGLGRAGQGPGRTGGTKMAGPAGTCVCPQCGHREPHQRGVPCFERQCPQCGAAMTRE
jgi:predicted Fe-Mo cluster-binding NifX family protein